MRKAEFIQAVARGVAQRSDIDAFLNEQGFGPGDDEEEAKEQATRVQRIAQLATFLADEVAKHAPFEDDMPALFGLGLKGPDVASLLLQFANAIEDLKGRVDAIEKTDEKAAPGATVFVQQTLERLEALERRVAQCERERTTNDAGVVGTILPLADCKKCGLRLPTMAGHCSGCGEPR